MNKKSLRDKNMQEALEILKIMGHPLRLSILCRLIEQGEMGAGEIVEAEQNQASQSQISQYLNQLKNQGLIEGRREGHYLYYRIADSRIKKLIQTLHQLYCTE